MPASSPARTCSRRLREREWTEPRSPAAANGKNSLLEPELPSRNRSEQPGKRRNARAANPCASGPYGVGQNRLRSRGQPQRAGADRGHPVQRRRDHDAQELLPPTAAAAGRRRAPQHPSIFILRSNTVTQMEQCLADIFHIQSEPMDVFTGHARDAGRHPACPVPPPTPNCRCARCHPQPTAPVGARGQPDQPQLRTRTVPLRPHLQPIAGPALRAGLSRSKDLRAAARATVIRLLAAVRGTGAVRPRASRAEPRSATRVPILLDAKHADEPARRNAAQQGLRPTGGRGRPAPPWTWHAGAVRPLRRQHACLSGLRP